MPQFPHLQGYEITVTHHQNVTLALQFSIVEAALNILEMIYLSLLKFQHVFINAHWVLLTTSTRRVKEFACCKRVLIPTELFNITDFDARSNRSRC